MADFVSIRVGELPNEAISLTDKFPHEVGTDLKQSTIEDLAIFISNYASTVIGVGFRAVTVLDGQTLPTTDKEEFILVGAGIFYNVGGGSTIVLTEELNALISNGEFWTVGVEIPVNVQAVISQSIRSGFTNTSPSEDAIFKALALKANSSDIPIAVPKITFTANGVQDTFNIGVSSNIIAVFWNGALLNDNDWTQSGTNFTLTFIPDLGAIIKPI